MYCDAHGHWTDPRVSEETKKSWLENSLKNQISLFMEAGVDPEGWQREIDLQKKFPQNFKIAFGLHPYFVAQNDEATCDAAMDKLSKLLMQAQALGETGLDFREPYLGNGGEDRQFVFFENQIQLAVALKKPLILHVVRAHNEALRALMLWDANQAGGMVHAFNGSFEVAEQYLRLGFLISVGGALTFEKNKKLIEAVKKIPLENLLIESDAPDQAPEGWLEAQNSPLSVLKVAEAMAQIKQTTAQEILEKTAQNFKRLFR